MSDYATEMVRQASIYIKLKEFNTARRYLDRALMSATGLDVRAEIYFLFSEITSDPAEKRKYLEDTLAINVTDARARRSLAILDGKLKPDEIVNPDELPAPEAGTEKATASRFTCPKCGGRMTFDGDGRTLVCESCTVSQAPAGAVLEEEQDFFVAMASGKGHSKPVSTKTFHCQGCGAEFLLPPRVISENCAYCGSAHVVSMTREMVIPDVIIPMAFNRRGAAARLVRWVEKNKIEPEGKVQAPHGLYLPVWTFDLSGQADWKGVIYRNKQVIPTSGFHMLAVDDFPVPGSKKMTGLFETVLAEFNFREAPTYDPRYLAGWPAEVYDTAMSDASLEARGRTVKNTRQEIQNNNPQVHELACIVKHLGVNSFKLGLAPVWVTEYKLEGKRYRVIINGQNGAVHGETPTRGILDWLEDLMGE